MLSFVVLTHCHLVTLTQSSLTRCVHHLVQIGLRARTSQHINACLGYICFTHSISISVYQHTQVYAFIAMFALAIFHPNRVMVQRICIKIRVCARQIDRLIEVVITCCGNARADRISDVDRICLSRFKLSMRIGLDCSN